MELNPLPDGRHRVMSREGKDGGRPLGWVKVPKRLAMAVRRCRGYCEPVLKEDTLVGIIPTEAAAPDEWERLDALALAGLLTQDAYEVIILGGTYE